MLHNEAYIGTMYYNRRESIRCESKSASRRRRPSMRYQDRPAAEWIPFPVSPVPPVIYAKLFRRSQAIHYDNSRFSPRHLKSGQSGHYLLRRLGPVNTYLSASKMSTKWMKPMNITSSFSNRENIRR